MPIQFYHHTDTTSFFEKIQKYIQGKTVIVFPDDFAIQAYLTHCPIDDSILVIPDSLTETKKHKAFFSLYNGEKNIII